MDPKDYVVTSDTEVEEVDLDDDAHAHYLPSGTRLTEERAEDLGERASAEYVRRRGRPSLSGTASSSPRVSVRLPQDTYDMLLARAAEAGRSVSEVSREVLDAFTHGRLEIVISRREQDGAHDDLLRAAHDQSGAGRSG